MWYDDLLGLHEEVFAFTDGKCQKGEKGQKISKAILLLIPEDNDWIS